MIITVVKFQSSTAVALHQLFASINTIPKCTKVASVENTFFSLKDNVHANVASNAYAYGTLFRFVEQSGTASGTQCHPSDDDEDDILAGVRRTRPFSDSFFVITGERICASTQQ